MKGEEEAKEEEEKYSCCNNSVVVYALYAMPSGCPDQANAWAT